MNVPSTRMCTVLLRMVSVRARAGPGRGLGGTGHPRAQASQARAQACRTRAPGQAWAWWCSDATPGQEILAWLPGPPGTRVPGLVLVVKRPKTRPRWPGPWVDWALVLPILSGLAWHQSDHSIGTCVLAWCKPKDGTRPGCLVLEQSIH